METTMISIDEELKNSIAGLNEVQKKSILELIKSFTKKVNEEMKPQTIEEYNREIEEADARIDAGIFYTQEEVEAMAKNW